MAKTIEDRIELLLSNNELSPELFGIRVHSVLADALKEIKTLKLFGIRVHSVLADVRKEIKTLKAPKDNPLHVNISYTDSSGKAAESKGCYKHVTIDDDLGEPCLYVHDVLVRPEDNQKMIGQPVIIPLPQIRKMGVRLLKESD